MKQPLVALLLVVLAVLGVVILNSAYIIDQTQQVVITQFGEPVGDPIKNPGLHWKTPFVQVIHSFDNRILEWDGYPSEVPTLDKKFIWVDVTGRWRIEDPLKFLQTMHTERNAQTRLDDIMDGITRNYITRYRLVDVVRSSNDIMKAKKLVEGEGLGGEGVYEKIKVGRNEITRQILISARKILKDYGIQLVDLRIKRINYIESVQQKVFDRMISERKRAAEQLRSEGQGVRAEIEGRKDKELKRITSEAYKTVQGIKGAADAEATQIYGDAYSKDPDFYAFTNTLERYPETLKNARLLLTTDSEFLKYLKQSD